MKPFEIGTRVRAVRGPKNTMNPERRFVGLIGQVSRQYPPIDGMPYYYVEFGERGDFIDHCNLEEV